MGAESTTTSSYGLVSSDTRCDSPGFGDSPRSPYRPAVAVTSLPALARPVMPRTHRVSVTRPVRELTRFHNVAILATGELPETRVTPAPSLPRRAGTTGGDTSRGHISIATPHPSPWSFSMRSPAMRSPRASRSRTHHRRHRVSSRASMISTRLTKSPTRLAWRVTPGTSRRTSRLRRRSTPWRCPRRTRSASWSRRYWATGPPRGSRWIDSTTHSPTPRRWSASAMMAT